MYNLTGLQNATGFMDLLRFNNYATGDVFTSLLMITIFCILVLIMKRYDLDKSLVASSFLCFVLSIFLTAAKVLNFWFPITFLIIMAGTVLIKQLWPGSPF